MKTLVVMALCLGTAAICAEGLAPTKRSGGVSMEATAQAFLGSLDSNLRSKAQLEFGSENRLDWHYVPRERRGVAIGELSPPQRMAAHDLLRSALSAQGYLKVHGIFVLEEILKRDPGLYFLSVFGAPGGEDPWGWRIEGHHLSLNFSAGEDSFVSHTPFFLGSQPSEVELGHHAGLKVLAEEEELARQLVSMLDEKQLALAHLNAEPPADIILAPGRDRTFEKRIGLPLELMDVDQRTAFFQLLEQYVFNLRAPLAQIELERIRANGIQNIHFLWIGSLERGAPHYYRIHGPHFAIEYDNVQNGANHAHSVWHDLELSFGGDILLEHHEEVHRGR